MTHIWEGIINDKFLDVKILAYPLGNIEQPKGLYTKRYAGSLIKVEADEKFIMILEYNNVMVVTLHPQQVK